MKKAFIFFFFFTIFISFKLSAQTLFESFTFKGKIGTHPIVMTFLVPDHFYNYDQGYYYYTSQKKKIQFRGPEISEIGTDGKQKMFETVNGKRTGYFEFINLDVMVSTRIVGNWFTMDGKTSFPVVLNLEKVNHP